MLIKGYLRPKALGMVVGDPLLRWTLQKKPYILRWPACLGTWVPKDLKTAKISSSPIMTLVSEREVNLCKIVML